MPKNIADIYVDQMDEDDLNTFEEPIRQVRNRSIQV